VHACRMSAAQGAPRRHAQRSRARTLKIMQHSLVIASNSGSDSCGAWARRKGEEGGIKRWARRVNSPRRSCAAAPLPTGQAPVPLQPQDSHCVKDPEPVQVL
jgi:hypothetical protein